jgi:soluble lytic murein transglycosylase-like protein
MMKWLLTLPPLAVLIPCFCLLVAVSTSRSVASGSLSDTALIASQETLSPPVQEADSPYVAVAIEAAVQARLSPQLFVRQIQVESGFNPAAVSPAGAVGIAQFLPSTAAGLGIDPWNPEAALRGAARLMASYVQSYQGDDAKALAAYNAGTGSVEQAISLCAATARPWQACLPTETQRYLTLILS